MDTLTLLVRVRCLSCGSTYAKPVGRSTVKTNPGCPECGYLGWSPVEEELSEGARQRRFAADRRPSRSARQD